MAYPIHACREFLAVLDDELNRVRSPAPCPGLAEKGDPLAFLFPLNLDNLEPRESLPLPECPPGSIDHHRIGEDHPDYVGASVRLADYVHCSYPLISETQARRTCKCIVLFVLRRAGPATQDASTNATIAGHPNRIFFMARSSLAV